MNESLGQSACGGRRATAVRGGQSLVEVIVALGILSTAVAAALTLSASSLNAQTDNQGYMVATNLAREGIEVARNIRDSNWLADQEWDSGLYGADDDYSAIAVFNRVSGDWTMNFTPDDLGQASTRIWSYLTDPVGIYVQAVSQPANTAATRFYRLVTLQPVCRDGVVKSEGSACDPLTDPKVGIRIRSQVSWTVGGRDRQAEVEETMYDWR